MHVRGLPAIASPTIRRRLGALLRHPVALVQAEEYRACGYLFDVPDRVPTIFSSHNTDSEVMLQQAARAASPVEAYRLRQRAARVRRGEQRAARTSSAVLCVSEHDRAYFAAGGAGDRAVLVPNGVDDELFAIPPSDGQENVLFSGRLDYWPNADGLARFLPAWSKVVAERPSARLRLAGGGAPEPLITMARELKRVDVLGFVDDLREELASARVVVVPVWQGGGTRIKVLEAMAAGRPVVGTALGLEEVGFRPGEHGVCATDPAQLAARTIELLADPERARGMGAAAREHARAFRWTSVTREAESLYRSFAERAGSV
jgi:glycosyltransferase involved in cell wall biosynthesis